MKRTLAFTLSIVITFSLCACGGKKTAVIDCSNCGESISKNAAFCEHCGESTNKSSDTSSQPTTSNGSSVQSESTGTSKPTASSEPATSNNDVHTHSFSVATCTEPAMCSCGVTNGDALGHNWQDATCVTLKTCQNCGTSTGKTLGHSYSNGKCSRCGATDPSTVSHNHSFSAATCTAAAKCSCGATNGNALGHSWNNATCVSPKACSRCKTTTGSALGHSWQNATCTSPKACSRCKITSGKALGHSYSNGKCSRCGSTNSTVTGWEDFDPYAYMPQSSKGATIRYATWIDQRADIGAYTLANVKNDIGIDVELYFVKQGGYVQEIITKIASKDIPDVFVSNEASGAFPITLQIAAPINKVSSVELKDPRFDQTFLKNATIEGNTYFLNTVGNPMATGNMVFYNKRLFGEQGFTTPEELYENGEWSWDALLKCAKDIKALGDNYKGIFLELDVLAGSVGASVTQYNFSTHTFSNGTQNPTLLKAYQWYADANAQGLFDGNLASFIDGKCGFYICGPCGLQTKGCFMNMDFEDIGFTWLPSFTEGKKGLISSIYGAHGIVDGAPNADAAGYFIRYWLDYKNWDLENVFFSVEAGQFYYKITEATADEKYFNFDWPLAVLSGHSNVNSAFYDKIKKTSKNDMKTTLDSMSNIVDTAVEEGNNLILDKIAADRIKYGA